MMETVDSTTAMTEFDAFSSAIGGGYGGVLSGLGYGLGAIPDAIQTQTAQSPVFQGAMSYGDGVAKAADTASKGIAGFLPSTSTIVIVIVILLLVFLILGKVDQII